MSIRRSEITIGSLHPYGRTTERVITFIRDPRDRFCSGVAEALERRHLPTRRPPDDMRLLGDVDRALPTNPAGGVVRLLERLVEGPVDMHLWPYHYYFCDADAVPRSKLEIYDLKNVRSVLAEICGRAPQLGGAHAAAGRKLKVKEWVRQGLRHPRAQGLFTAVYETDMQLWAIVRRRPLLLTPDEDYYTQIGYVATDH